MIHLVLTKVLLLIPEEVPGMMLVGKEVVVETVHDEDWWQENEEEIVYFVKMTFTITWQRKKKDIQWRPTPYTPEMSISGQHINTTGPLTNYSCVYFKRCIASEMFQLMTIMINVYAEQNAVRRDKHASVHEKEALLELNMAIGVLDFSQSVNALGF